jgi:hypothetical protein
MAFPVHKIQSAPQAVTPALLGGASTLGLQTIINDPAAGHFEFRTGPGRGGKAARLTISLTDDGFGATALHVAVEPASSRSGKRAARRLVQQTRRECEGDG